jgi:hypothetical protein
MGRQTRFHMLAEDCKRFIEFVRQRDPIIVVDWRSDADEIKDVKRPWERGEMYYLWNQAAFPSLRRKFVQVRPGYGSSYYGIDQYQPVIQFMYPSPVQEPWNGRPALTKGRVWASFDDPPAEFGRWYDAVVRWIRRNFIRDKVLGDYVGPAAYQWFKEGGVLLPHTRPPLTSSWLSWVEAQDQHRAVFVK